ncbi:TPA: hypothetical protein ACYUTM_001882 [Serratia marcescens]|uniref:hypothetical protein n=1 Tax=Serratia TaxID=613 RepID=UPI000745134F|nr:hypothetical protein [Serratia marcescens]MBH3279957.1 hypothetical protein [Serratia marcescens]CVA06627.1 Uncharacterised protein [Serratia marcescens]CVA08824.1 Uncharacterised protein [Serratia marcescens]HEN7340371.1 hypothetical protein [Serratia marcescens]HEN7411113.1 hypothetical protein [Serratia marcescens]
MNNLTISVDVFESERINSGIRKLVLAGMLKDNPETQMGRVIQAAVGAQWMTLRKLERTVFMMFFVADTQAAISARLREVDPKTHGLIKEKRTVKDPETGRPVYFYRLVAATEKEKAA